MNSRALFHKLNVETAQEQEATIDESDIIPLLDDEEALMELFGDVMAEAEPEPEPEAEIEPEPEPVLGASPVQVREHEQTMHGEHMSNTENTNQPTVVATITASDNSLLPVGRIVSDRNPNSCTGGQYGIYVLQALGDLVVTSQIAKQLKADDPNGWVVWFVLKKNAFVLKGNPYIDEIVELEGNNRDWDEKIQLIKDSRAWTKFLIPQPHLAYADCPGGDLVELVKAAIKLDWTVPYVPVLRLDEAEVSRARDYVATLGQGLKIMVETEFQSEQSPWNVNYAKVMIERLRHLNPIFIFSAKNEPSYLPELRQIYSRIEWCQLPFRENAELFNHMDAFVGVSSGISCVSYSDWCKIDIPRVEVVNNTHWSSYHFTHQTKRRLCFEEQSYDVALTWLVKVLEGRISGTENPQTRRMDLYTMGKEGKYTYFCKTILPSTFALKEDLRTMAVTLLDFPEFYLICGDLDDAMITLSKALDENKLINVIVCSQHFEQLRAFFDEHSLIRNVFVIPYPAYRPESQTHLMIQMAYQPNCLGVGMKCSEPAFRGLFTAQRIKELSVVKANPQWASRYQAKRASMKVVIEAHGPAEKAYRSERAIINPRWWQPMLHLLQSYGIRPVIIGDPQFNVVYAVDEHCDDHRRDTKRQQLQLMREADLYIGSDSMLMTIASMSSVRCIRCAPMHGHDLHFYKDALMQTFRSQWTNVSTVATIDELVREIRAYAEERGKALQPGQVAREIAKVSAQPHRTDPKDELTSFHRVFWDRNYAEANSVLLRGSTAVGDSLMLTNVVRALKTQHPHLHIYMSGSPASLEIFRHNPDIDKLVLRNSAEELMIEATADEVVEYNFIIDQFPEYYNGIHLSDILANITGVHVDNHAIHYNVTQQERAFADACLNQYFKGQQVGMLIGLHLFTEKDPQRSYRHASGLIEYLNHMFPGVGIVNFGQTSFRKDYANVLDCPKYNDIGLRHQIALAERCSVFITIDSAFFHVAHNLMRKPTMAIQSVVNEFLTGDPSLGLVKTVRNTEKGCKGCYWVPGVCKTECLPTLHPHNIASEFLQFVRDIQAKVLPYPAPVAELEVPIRYDQRSKNLAATFRNNSYAQKNIRPMVFAADEALPPYARQWNGVEIVDPTQVPDLNQEPKAERVKEYEAELSWS